MKLFLGQCSTCYVWKLMRGALVLLWTWDIRSKADWGSDLGENSICFLSSTLSVWFNLPIVPDGQGLYFRDYWLYCTGQAQSSSASVFVRKQVLFEPNPCRWFMGLVLCAWVQALVFCPVFPLQAWTASVRISSAWWASSQVSTGGCAGSLSAPPSYWWDPRGGKKGLVGGLGWGGSLWHGAGSRDGRAKYLTQA